MNKTQYAILVSAAKKAKTQLKVFNTIAGMSLEKKEEWLLQLVDAEVILSNLINFAEATNVTRVQY